MDRPLEPSGIVGKGVSYSQYAEECFAAKQWGIPLTDWFAFSRDERAAHIATCVALHRIESYFNRDG